MLPETIATLGIVDTHAEIDEDYLIVGPNNPQKGAVIQARVNRPEPRMAKQLISEGAMVASGILLGYAHAFAARITKYWPHPGQELTDTVEYNCFPEGECRLIADTYRHIPRSVVNSMRLSPPAFPMRAFRVQGSGWCSRKPLGGLRPESEAGQRANTRAPNLALTE